jgi:predicted  nucleic acid-binding Zn-ribbon protein
MSDLDDRLTAAITLRNRLSAESQRIAGRKEAAEKALAEVESEIRSKNLDPDSLDETLVKLTEAYEKAVEAFEADVEKAKQSLAPYMENHA